MNKFYIMIINGIILSAGFSKRMDNFKPLAIFNDNTFIQNIILKLNSICDQIIIVTNAASAIITELKAIIVLLSIRISHYLLNCKTLKNFIWK